MSSHLFVDSDSAASADSFLPAKSPTEDILQDMGVFPEDQYEPIKVLKSTLQGKVVKSKHKETGQEVAVKLSSRVLARRRRSSSGKKVLENCFRELKVMEYLQDKPHPNVIQLIEAYADDENQYLILEFAGKGELYDIVDEIDDGLPEDVCINYFYQIFLGVQHIHSHGICHLDMSLENVFVSEDNVPKIGDFGVAREFKPDEPFFSTTGIKPGKQNYMAPEIVETGFYNGNEADMFSLGVMLFVMLYGFPPFEEASSDDLRWQYIRGGKLEFLLQKWDVEDKVSPSAVDLVKGLLCSADDRINIEEALAHEWFDGIRSEMEAMTVDE